MALSESIIDAVANTNVKVVGDSPAFYAGLAMGNAASSQQRIQGIAEAALAAAIKRLTEIDIEEAVAVKQATTGDTVAEAISRLGAAIAGLQQIIKTSQTTPPETGK